MEETIRQFSPEQEDKITRLREEAEQERDKKTRLLEESKAETEWKRRFEIEKGCDCTLTIDGVTIIGTVLEIYEGKHDTSYDVSTPMGVLKNFKRLYPSRKIWKKQRVDYSHIKIPEILKPASTQALLRMLNVARINGYDTMGKWPDTQKVSYDELKAILATREHVPNTKEKKVIKAYQEQNK